MSAIGDLRSHAHQMQNVRFGKKADSEDSPRLYPRPPRANTLKTNHIAKINPTGAEPAR